MSHESDGHGVSPPDVMLRLHRIVVLVAATIAITGVLLATMLIDSQAGSSRDHATAAVEAAQIQADLRDPVAVLFATAYSFINSDQLAMLPDDVRETLLTNVLMQVEALRAPSAFPIPPLRVDISERNAFALQSSVHSASERIDRLNARTGGEVDLSLVLAERDALQASMAEFLETKSAGSFRDMFANLVMLGVHLSDASDAYGAGLESSHTGLATITGLTRYVLVPLLALLATGVLLVTFRIGKLIRREFERGEAEHEELRATTTSLQYRNDQLSALYNVFSEITDTLSMRYVISATLRETLRVMRASVVTLRLLKGSQLIVAGSLSSSGEPILSLQPVPLGEGPTGRVARRGRSMRIDSNAQDMLGPNPNPDSTENAQSGIIVPLIVGARVVGTLACWSHEANAFQDQDERVLEMMASQVATAVLAADTQETLERRALSDPLTNLPNRRQLSEDMTEFGAWGREGRSAVVAMMDIDHFKQLNDDFGHKVGDVTLQKVAAVMGQAIRDCDRIYRYGGEEFIIIFSDVMADEGVVLAGRVLRAVAETPLTGDHLEPVGPVTISAGLACMPVHGTDVTDLIVLADRAMYRAKQSGRNRIEVWDEDAPRTLASSAA